MIGQYLPQTNENAIVLKSEIFSELNQAYIQRNDSISWKKTHETEWSSQVNPIILLDEGLRPSLALLLLFLVHLY